MTATSTAFLEPRPCECISHHLHHRWLYLLHCACQFEKLVRVLQLEDVENLLVDWITESRSPGIFAESNGFPGDVSLSMCEMLLLGWKIQGGEIGAPSWGS